MNKEAEARLKKILAKEPHELTDFDKGFLRARRAYVGRRSREKFAEILREAGNVSETKGIKEKLEVAAQEADVPFQTVDTEDEEEKIVQIN